MVKKDSVYTEIAGTAGGISVGILVILKVFPNDMLGVAAIIIAALVIFGIVIGYLQYREVLN